MRIVSIGEVLWDVIGDSEYLGGAPLNFAAHAHKLGHEVYLVSAVGEDERGERALDAMQRLNIARDFVQVVPDRPTGTAEVELDPSGKPTFRILRPAAYDCARLTPEVRKHIAGLRPDWIYFGTLFHTPKTALAATWALLEEIPSAKRIYDVNLREGQWSLGTVEQLASCAGVIKLSDSEAEFLDASLDANGEETSVRHFCERWCDQYKCRTVCVTLGERGCASDQGQRSRHGGRGRCLCRRIRAWNGRRLADRSLRRFCQCRSGAGGKPCRRDSGVDD
jgi:fructokinase